MNETTAYHSETAKSATQALYYTKTHQSSHRYLAYRDIPALIEKYIHGTSALDYGTGTGCSAGFLLELGLNVIGVDISKEMLLQAMMKYPHIPFHQVQNGAIPFGANTFDLVFSSLVLFEMGTEREILSYLEEARRVLAADGVFIAITGSQYLHSSSKFWMNFQTAFPENKNPKSRDLVKLYVNDAQIEFSDFYWTEADYRLLFDKAGFQLIEVLYPLGKENEPYSWKDEKTCSPFVIFVAKK